MSTKRQNAQLAKPPEGGPPETVGTQHAMAMVAMQSTSSPLPSPEMLEGYARVSADFPERLMQLVEARSRHRQQLETTNLDPKDVEVRVVVALGPEDCVAAAADPGSPDHEASIARLIESAGE